MEGSEIPKVASEHLGPQPLPEISHCDCAGVEPPGGTHTTIDLYSKLSADPTIFAKLRIKSEKADA